MNEKSITIAGGGVAGLTLGIGLRQRGVGVTVFEAGAYPRHRVCGEFICGRGLEVLRRLGLIDLLASAGAVPAPAIAFFLGRTVSPVRRLEPVPLSLSRYKLDALLAEEFRRVGGILLERKRWQGGIELEGLVVASGRRAQPIQNGWRWFGLKAHARNVTLTADLEMHCLPNEYVGISRLGDGSVNVCGLFRQRAGSLSAPRPWRECLRGPNGSSLNSRMGKAVFDEDSFCSVAGLPLGPQRAGGRDECCLGDALTMIPPVTGNGMSMAFEAAAMALEPLTAYSRGELDWHSARQIIARACDAAFAQRLAWARWLQRILFAAWLQGSLSGLVTGSNLLWRVMFDKTR